jgi:beta-glucosidase
MKTRFEENLLIGYRYYDCPEHTVKVRFPFGFGLSYTTFESRFVAVVPPAAAFDASRLTLDVAVGTVSAVVSNTGRVRGAEVLQVYLGPVQPPTAGRPLKELVGFQKVWLEPGASSNVYVEFDVQRAVEFFKVSRNGHGQAGQWTVTPNSSFNIFLGTSAIDAKQVQDKTRHNT